MKICDQPSGRASNSSLREGARRVASWFHADRSSHFAAVWKQQPHDTHIRHLPNSDGFSDGFSVVRLNKCQRLDF